MDVEIEGELDLGIGCHCLCHLAHIGGESRNALESRFFIQQRVQTVDRVVFLALEMNQNGRDRSSRCGFPSSARPKA